jgi:hypothetical protein
MTISGFSFALSGQTAGILVHPLPAHCPPRTGHGPCVMSRRSGTRESPTSSCLAVATHPSGISHGLRISDTENHRKSHHRSNQFDLHDSSLSFIDVHLIIRYEFEGGVRDLWGNYEDLKDEFKGRYIRKTEPSPTLLSTSIRPPRAATSSLTMASPNPSPAAEDFSAR